MNGAKTFEKSQLGTESIMETTSKPAISKGAFWGGWVMSAIPAAMLLMSAVMKLTKNPQAVEGFAKMGYPSHANMSLGVVELLCTVIYLIPQTSVLGAILLTGYLGGAIDVHVRTSQPIYMPLAFGILVWGGLFLRDPRIRALIPFKTK